MAWRIDEAVIRGEIDNRVRGRVTGRIWFFGRAEPLELDLEGNAWRDLAGRRLEFVNPDPKPGDFASIATRQTGVIGDCTASRKVKVPEVSMEELMKLYKQRKPFPWHWGNSLYLEWFSETNGRVMIESASYTLTIDPESTWEMTSAEEQEQQGANGAAMTDFMSSLDAAVAPGDPTTDTPGESDSGANNRDEFEDEDSWDDDEPQTEEEAEKMQNDSDRLIDRINVRVNREGAENYRKILEEELERRRRERGERPLTPEEEAQRAEWIEEMNRAGAEVSETLEREFEEEPDRTHPLAGRAFELAGRLMDEPADRGWVPADATDEHPVADLVSSVMSAAAKLAGALNDDWPPARAFCAGVIVRLKRARECLDHALLAAACCSQQALVDPTWLAEIQGEIEALGCECDKIIAELRSKLERGFD